MGSEQPLEQTTTATATATLHCAALSPLEDPPPGLRRAYSEASRPITSHSLDMGGAGWHIPGREPGSTNKSLTRSIIIADIALGHDNSDGTICSHDLMGMA